MRAWKVNGLSLTLDLDDADVMERYEAAFVAMEEEESEIPADGKQSVRIRAYCKLFFNLFSRIFDEDTAEKLFEGVPVSCTAYDEIYLSFLDFVRSQAAETARARAEKLAKYRPKK